MARLSFYFLFLLCVLSGPSLSKNYQLSQETNVTFKYFVAGLPLEGEFRVVESKFDINFQNPSKSIFFVEFDLMQSNAGFLLATKAMKQVLDAYRVPTVIFESTSVEFKDEKVHVIGFLKVRNVSKPVNLKVTVLENYSSNSEKVRFSIRASFNRRQFGADDYYPLVSDAIIIEDVLTINKSQ